MLKKLRFRFRLRTLLVLFVVVAVFCWWKDRPRRIALQFIRLVNNGEYPEAEGLMVTPPFIKSAGGRVGLGLERIETCHANLEEYSLADWWQGEMDVKIQMIHNAAQFERTEMFVVSRDGVDYRRDEPVTINTYVETPDVPLPDTSIHRMDKALLAP